MKRVLFTLFAVFLTALFSTRHALAATIDLGFVSYDVGVNGPNTAEFDIVNGTGADNFDPVDFPINAVSFSDLSLTVLYANGQTVTFGPSYFTVDPFDQLSFNGTPLITGLGAPDGLLGAVGATLTGELSTDIFSFQNGPTYMADSSFIAIISDPSGLQNGDYALIEPTPEPNAFILAGTGLLGLFLLQRRRFIPAFAAASIGSGRGRSRTALAIGAIFFLTCAAGVNAQSVTLTASASPSSGTSGVSAVTITGSGFPSGTVSAGNITVSVASACGVSGATAPAVLVTKIITSERIQFVLPASLASGTYYISLSGTTSTGATFGSTNCAEISVVGSAPIASLSVSSITFPSITAGSSDPTQTVNLSNPGSGTLTISNIAVTGTGASYFPESNNCGSAVASGSYCTITVGFNPALAGPYTPAITITDNASPATQTVALSGTATAPFLSGNVYGGTQPINGATVTLWSAGTTTFYGAGATSLATTTTNTSGSFSFSGASHCTTGQSLYVTSVGGSSGPGANQYAALMAALPAACSSATAGSSLVVNEVTTVASVTALQQFMAITPGGAPAWMIGAPAANATGLANAFLQVGTLVNPATGASAPTTASNTINSVAYTTTITPDTNKINALADILSACVGTAGSATCTSLFADTTPQSAVAPADTIQAAFYLATNAGGLNLPAHGATQGEPYYLCSTYASGSSPFQPYSPCTSTSYPTDWTIDVSWTSANGTTNAASVAIDGSGNIWTSALNSSTTGLDVTEFNQAGQIQIKPATTASVVGGWQFATCTTCANPVSLGGTHTGDGIAIDTNGNAWATSWNGTTNTIASQIEAPVVKVTPGTGAASAYLVGYSPAGITIDGSNNLYVGDGASTSANRYYESELAAAGTTPYSTLNSGTGRTTNGTYYSTSTEDEVGYVWPDTDGGETTIPRISSTGVASTVGSTTALPSTVYWLAADANGNAWGSTTTTTSGAAGLDYINVSSSIASPTVTPYAIGTNGNALGGLYGPQGMAIDGEGDLWVVNANGTGTTSAGGGISEFAPSNGTSLTPLSPSGTGVWGFFSNTTIGAPIGAAIDNSGNVWFKTRNGNNLYHLVGVAAPVVTPIAQMVKTGFIGARPGALTLVSLSPALTYSTVASLSEPLMATLTNTGTAPVNVGQMSIGSTNHADFTITGTSCEATLGVGANCTITVAFNSAAVGTFSSTLNVATNAAGSPASVTLTGTAAASDGTVGLDAGTNLSVSTPSITFPTIVAGGVSTAQAVILSNTGSVPLSLSLGMSGAGANLFPQTTSCGSSLAAGASCFVSFKFGPKVAGSYSAVLNLTDNAGTGAQSIQLSGTAAPFTITVNNSNANGWVIDNGAITFNWSAGTGNLTSWVLDGYSDQLVDTTTTSNGLPEGLYMDNTGSLANENVPTGGTAAPSTAACTIVGGTIVGTPTTACTVGTGSTPYFDWSQTIPDSANSGNDYTFVEHWIVFPNDPGVHTYVQLIHNSNDGAGSVGQIQWVFRDSLSIFTNTYEVNSGLNWLGVEDIPQPSVADTSSADPGRAVQNAAEDLHGFTDLPAGFGREFYTKYDYAGYEYLHQGQGVYGVAPSGTTYGVWTVLPKLETFVGGPTKQDLYFTNNIDMIEAYSDHEDEPMNLNTAAGTAYNRLFGPYYIHVNTLGQAYNQTGNTLATKADMYADAISAGAALASQYDNEAQLVAAGYVPSTGRGSVSVQVNGVTGSQYTAWAVLSDPNTNFQVSCNGLQYWADMSATGSTTFTGVAPGTYRLSVYVLGQWGEYRQDGIVVTANNTTTVPTVTFQPENFAGTTGTTVFTIGTPDRSAHEFLHGHNTTTGNDDREFYGNWNYWKDFASTQGAVVYYATAVGSTPATNNLNLWNYNHWGTSFNPGLYAGVFNSADDTTDAYQAYPGQEYPGINGVGAEYAIPSYVAGLPGASGTNGAGTAVPPWQVYFATPSNISTYSSGYVQLSISAACVYGSYVVTLNGHQLIWHYTNYSDCMDRSGLSGYTQWFVMEFPVSDLNQTVGGSNEITISMSQVNGASDDALRLELTNSTSNPASTGWNDYTYISGSTTTLNNDTVSNPTPPPQ